MKKELTIKEKIKSMKSMQDLLLVYRLHKYPEYRQWIDDYECNSVFKFQDLGMLNKGKNIYFIGDLNQASGFFWSWKVACRGLMIAERYNFIPVIDWTKGPYFEEEGYGGYINPFEYYFESISDISVDDARQSSNVCFYNRRHSSNKNMVTYSSQEYKLINEFARINGKFIHIKKDLYDDLLLQIEVLLNGKKTIGVHVRGVEWGKIKYHPIPVALEAYIQRIDVAFEGNGFEQIFLATDSEETVLFFKKRFGNKVVCYNDVERTPKGSKTLVIFDENIKKSHSHYWLGYEVLKDMLTLSFCQGLVAGLSNVSFAAEVFKLTRGEEYEYKNMVEQIVNKKGMSSLKAEKLMKENKFKG